MEDFPFSDGDVQRIAFEEMAKMMVPMFNAMVNEGLQPAHAAALTAAYWQQLMPTPPQGPQDGS